MEIALITFDGFTDVDLFLPWDLLHRPREQSWRIRILGTEAEHVSSTGLAVATHGKVEEAADADVVIVGSGAGLRPLLGDAEYLARLVLDPKRQMIGSMCAGALLLGALGHLRGLRATTYPTAAAELAAYGVEVVEEPFVAQGKVATAAGCLAAQSLIGWVVAASLGEAASVEMLRAVQPIGQGLSFADADRFRYR